MTYKKAKALIPVVFLIVCFLILGCVKNNESRAKQKLDIKPLIGFEANMNVLQDIVDGREKDIDWQTVFKSAIALRDLKDQRTEQPFLKILQRQEPIRLRKGSDLPEAMSPLNMLKMVAMQSIRQTGGKKYTEAFFTIYKQTDERILRETAKEYIIGLGGKVPK